MQKESLASFRSAIELSGAAFTVSRGKMNLPLGSNVEGAIAHMVDRLKSGFVTHPPSPLTSSGLHVGTQILITEPIKEGSPVVTRGAVTIYTDASPTKGIDESAIAFALLSIAAQEVLSPEAKAPEGESIEDARKAMESNVVPFNPAE